jgi:hypothetical protein
MQELNVSIPRRVHSDPRPQKPASGVERIESVVCVGLARTRAPEELCCTAGLLEHR